MWTWDASYQQQFEGAKSLIKVRDRNNMPGISQTSMQVLWGKSCTQAESSIWEIMCQLQEMGHFKKVCMTKKNCAVHEVEVEVTPEPQEEEIETVSINSIYLNRNR